MSALVSTAAAMVALRQSHIQASDHPLGSVPEVAIAQQPTQSGFSPGSITRLQYYTGSDGDSDQNYGNLYLPLSVQDHTPIVVLIHGGGWKASQGGADAFDTIARDLQAAGLAVWNIEYRRVGNGGGWDNTFVDVARAIDYVDDLVSQVPSLDSTQVISVGHSAGGQLATWTAARGERPLDGPGPPPRVIPRAVVSLSGSLDMAVTARSTGNATAVLGGLPSQVPERYHLVNPIERINPQIPIVIVHSRDDKTVPYSVAPKYADAARKLGEHVVVRSLRKGGHGGPITRSYGWPETRELIVTTALAGVDAAADRPWSGG